MSGSSLDGVDLVYVNFSHDNKRWPFQIMESDNISYSYFWKERLSQAFNKNPDELQDLDKQYGVYLGTITKKFIEKYNLSPDLIASHGHTIFHRPEDRYTLQIGDGQEIANISGIMTINDFRTEDVLKGGQGAPLVPIGDSLLFADYPVCLNIGGIANVSYDVDNNRIAYDICMANQLLNYLANKTGRNYDYNGDTARKGTVNIDLFNLLNDHSYYKQSPPKSLGREFFERNQRQIIDNSHLSIKDLLATATEHISYQISKATETLASSKMLVTGGGAKNQYLMERIKDKCKHEIVIPDSIIIDYKEALIFAFLGVLKMEGKINILSSVTGASSDSSAGKIWIPK